MTRTTRAFTIDIDEILYEQVTARTLVTGRTPSREISYLCSIALRRINTGSAEVGGTVGKVVRKCATLDGEVFNDIMRYASETKRSGGSAVNVLLRTALDLSANLNHFGATTGGGLTDRAKPRIR